MMPAVQEAVVHLSDRHFRSIAELIEGQVGIKLPQGKRLMLEGRLHKRVRALNFSDLNEYVDNLFEADHFDTELTHHLKIGARRARLGEDLAAIVGEQAHRLRSSSINAEYVHRSAQV